jgi:hypothetical protein
MMATRTRRARTPVGKIVKRAPRPRSEAATAERFESQTGFRPEDKPQAYKAYRAQQRGESPQGGADDVPSTRGPKAAPRGPRAPRIGTAGLTRSLRSFASRNPRRLLLAELLLVVVITITSRVSEGEVPRPSDLLAPFVVYLVLGFAAEVGGSTARFAAGLGGLVALAVVMANAGSIAKTITTAAMGGPTTPGAQGVSGFSDRGAGAGFGTAGGGGGGSW